jgi:hypothetical protein
MAMYSLTGIFYSTALRQKQGELIAALELSDASKTPQLPCFIAAPISGKRTATITQAGAIDLHVGSLLTHWPSRPCLLDMRFLKFDSDAGSDASWQAKMLERFRQFNGMVIPVADLHTNFYRAAAIGSHSRIAKSGVALRITMADLVRSDLVALLDTQLKNLTSEAANCIIVLDLTDADLTSPNEFAKFVAETLFKLRGIGAWAKIIVQATNYPFRNPAQDDNTADVPRKEWELWQATLKIDKAIRELAMFGDFGADNAHIDFKAGGRPIPHLRYTTERHWLVSRGNRDTGYGVMKAVTEIVVRSGFFSGELFSAGDEYIAARANGLNRVGNPMMWRSVNMNHHMTFVAAQLGDLYGLPIPANMERRHPAQEQLFQAPQEAVAQLAR